MILEPAYPTARATRRIVTAVARRTDRRLRIAARRLDSGRAGAALAEPGPLHAEARIVLAGLREAMADLPADLRERILFGPDLRGFLGEADLWIEVALLAAAARGGRSHLPLERLFDRISRTEHLAALLPSGRVDAGFPGRCAVIARRRLQHTLGDLASLVVGMRLAYPGSRRSILEARLEFRADPEQGRPGDRIDLGSIAGPAGPLSIVFTGRRRPRHLRVRLEAGTLAFTAPGSGRTVLPAAGSRLRVVDLQPVGRSRRTGGRPARAPRQGLAVAPLDLGRRETIPGTSILLAPAVHSSPRRLRVGHEVPGLSARLAQALRIVRIAWPEAHDEILTHTFMVVPVRERGLVSYSLASRPGVSFINVSGKTLVDLADDLLHETAHHRLHSLQEIETFLTPGPETSEVQAFDSPWRRTRRPLHGILHGGYTFLYRAELFRRLFRVARLHPRLVAPLLRPRRAAWVRREMRRESRMISGALRDLDRAGREGLLTPAGRGLVLAMRRWARRLLQERADGPARGR